MVALPQMSELRAQDAIDLMESGGIVPNAETIVATGAVVADESTGGDHPAGQQERELMSVDVATTDRKDAVAGLTIWAGAVRRAAPEPTRTALVDVYPETSDVGGGILNLHLDLLRRGATPPDGDTSRGSSFASIIPHQGVV
jgi:hypothetical protein